MRKSKRDELVYGQGFYTEDPDGEVRHVPAHDVELGDDGMYSAPGTEPGEVVRNNLGHGGPSLYGGPGVVEQGDFGYTATYECAGYDGIERMVDEGPNAEAISNAINMRGAPLTREMLEDGARAVRDGPDYAAPGRWPDMPSRAVFDAVERGLFGQCGTPEHEDDFGPYREPTYQPTIAELEGKLDEAGKREGKLRKAVNRQRATMAVTFVGWILIWLTLR